MPKNPVASFVVIMNLSSQLVISYSSSSQDHTALYEQEALIYVRRAPSER